MVTSSAQLSGASSSLNQPGVHNASRNAQQIPNVASSQSSAMPLPTSRQVPRSAEQQQQQPHSSEPSVVSRYMLPTYRQASSSNVSSSASPHNTSSSPAIHPLNASLPDILHSHMVPQIPRLRQNQRRQGDRDQRQGRERHRSEGDAPRHRHTHHGRGERRRTQLSSHSPESCSCKEPCVKCVVTFTSFRWVLVVLSILGVCCVVSGIVLAALHAAGSSFLFLAVMFIGLGILLVIVVSVGWKCTPRGHEPLHALLHIGQFGQGGSRDRHRRRRHRHRDGNWFGGVFYPEFQYRRPPPSYAASMQDYHNQSLNELSGGAASHPTQSHHERHGSLPGSPPPSYHSRTSTLHSGMNITLHDSNSQPNSRPPTYRSRAPSRRPSLPRHESPQGTETGSDPSLPTTSNTEQVLHTAVVGESISEPNVSSGSGLTTAAMDSTSLTISSSPSGHQIELSQRRDESDPPFHAAAQVHDGSSSPNEDQALSQAVNQNGNVEISSNSNTRDSTIVITNQPTSTLSPTTVTTSSTSFTPTSLPYSGSSENVDSDVHHLEQDPDSFDFLDELDGIDNPGASISSDSMDHYDTHL